MQQIKVKQRYFDKIKYKSLVHTTPVENNMY